MSFSGLARHKENPNHIALMNSLTSKPVQLLDLNSILIKEYSSVSAQARELKSSRKTIKKAIKNKTPFKGIYLVSYI